MKEIKFTPLELQNFIRNTNYIGRGYYGKIYQYGNRLLKLDCLLCHMLERCSSKEVDDIFEDYKKSLFMGESFANIDQIAYLSSLNEKIMLTQMPEGIVCINGTSPGIILIPHMEHDKLENFPTEDYEKVLKILRNLLLEVRELEDNGIAHNDLRRPDEYTVIPSYNILYKGLIPQIIDLDGDTLKYKDLKHTDTIEMYNQLGEIILDYFNIYKLTSNQKSWEVKNASNAHELLNELEGKMKVK